MCQRKNSQSNTQPTTLRAGVKNFRFPDWYDYLDTDGNSGEVLAITAGIPFGRSGTTNLLRLAKLNNSVV